FSYSLSVRTPELRSCSTLRMVARNSSSRLNCSLVMRNPSMIPGGDIAGVAAILSVSLGVIVKMPVANRAGHINRGAPDNLVAMCRPVFCAAFIRAEPPGFKAAIRKRLAALRTESTARFLLYVVGAGGVAVAKGLHSGLGQANFIGDLRKALTGLPQLYDLLP